MAESIRPFSIVADRGFGCLMKTGRPFYYIPSPSTVSHDVLLVFARTRQRVAKMLCVSGMLCKIGTYSHVNQEHDGRLSFATDAWSSPNHRAYMGVTVHLEQAGKPLSMVLDIVEVPRSHTGVNLARAFVGILRDFGIADRVSNDIQMGKSNASESFQILAVTCDNASNNNVMLREMEKRLPKYSSKNHVRCFLHIVNLIAKALVNQFDVREGPGDDQELDDLEDASDDSDSDEEEGGTVTYSEDEDEDLDDDDPNDSVDARPFLSQEEQRNLTKSLRPVKLLLTKVRSSFD